MLSRTTALPFALALLLACTCSHPGASDPDPGPQIVAPTFSLSARARTYWYLDDTFGTLLYPSISGCVPGKMCLIVSTGAWDYTCTAFPDTFWGVINYDYAPSGAFPPETLSCHSDTCWVRGDTIAYAMKPYFDSLANALCSPAAESYTARGLCYRLSPGEDTVRVYNQLFDTTFYGDSTFCLPRLPLDSLKSVYLSSMATFRLTDEFISAQDDYIDTTLLYSSMNH